MNEQNVEFLKERLFYLGFAEKLNNDLEANIKNGKEKFQLPLRAEFRNGEKTNVVEYAIDFTKSKTQDMYFLNKYQATLKNGEDPSKDKTQTFYINKGNGIAAKEAFNLLEGRAVFKKLFNKDGDEYKAWQKLNFDSKDKHGNFVVQSYHTAYGFDLEKSLTHHPIKELGSAEAREDILKSLEKGNRPRVTIEKDGKEEKMFLEADPRQRRIHVFDESGRKQFQGVREYNGEKSEQKQSNGQEQSSDQSNSQTKKEKSKKQESDSDPEAPRRSRRKGVSI